MKIYTHNLSIDNGDPERRLHDFSERVKASEPDILFLQEVSSELGYTALKNLTHNLGADYTMQYETVYPGKEDTQGIAVISKLPIIKSSMTTYADAGTQSQIVELKGKYGHIIGANVHHEDSLLLERMRQRKNTELANQLASEYKGTQHILAGTFNAWPRFPSIRSLQKVHGFESAYKAMHKHHGFTYPTMSISHLLDGKFMQAHEIQSAQRLTYLTNFMRSEKYEIPATTIDYIFLKDMGRVASATLVRSWKDVPANRLESLQANRDSPYAYAISDHYGIEIEVTP